jgi:transposase
LVYDVRRVYCPRHGTVVERVPWASEPRARFTDEFDDLVAFAAQRSDKTGVQRLMRISWRTVGRCIERVVERRRPAQPLAGLTAIGVDELSYRKHHHYLTLITDHTRRRVAWGKEGRNAKTLAAFFEELGEEGRAAIEFVTADLSAGYAKAIREAVPHATLIFDRFHVQRLVSDAVDETRREEWRRLRGTAEGAAMKKTRWALLKKPIDLTEAERTKLASIQRENQRLYRAYLLKEQLRDLLDRRQYNVVCRLLHDWLAWAARSRLPAFVTAARTIRQHFDGIVAYVRWRLTNSPHEGMNNKARLVTRRAYGFHSAEAVLAMIELCCSGLTIPLPHRVVA